MLARRFTIFCLLTTLFGMAFAILVADYSRPTRSKRIAEFVPCLSDGPAACRYADEN